MLCLFTALCQLRCRTCMYTLYDWILYRYWIMFHLYARMYFLLICGYLLILQYRYHSIKWKMHL